ncbi:InlB B-repeat-containing protein [Eggerthella timonensis]|uniref:InlB B-repeat-containing protein n=1 Tax=Eggerthella timonensis TaxID=1871008 RepID=UPI000C76D7BD|nr:InlB B-repeat-containing protein [Eggerthella timonensis]
MGHANRAPLGAAGKLLAAALSLALAASCLLVGFASADDEGAEEPAGRPEAVEAAQPGEPEAADGKGVDDATAEPETEEPPAEGALQASALPPRQDSDAVEDPAEDPEAEPEPEPACEPEPVQAPGVPDGEPTEEPAVEPYAIGDLFVYEGIRYSIMSAASGSSLGKVKVGGGTNNCVAELPADGVVTIPEGGVVTRVTGGVRYYYDVTRIANNAFKGVSGLKQINLPSTLKSIYITAFEGTSLTSITIPANVDYVDVKAFEGATMLKSVNVDPANQAFASDDGVLYTKDFKKLYRWPEGKIGHRAVIRKEASSIEDRAFANTPVTEIVQLGCIHSLGGSAASVFAGMDRANAKVWGNGCVSCTALQSQARWNNWGFPNAKGFPEWRIDVNYDDIKTPGSTSQAPGTKLAKPADPTRTGYTFGGWHKEAGCTTAWDFANDVMPEEDLVLYAKWEPIWYVIRYNLDGGSGTPPPAVGLHYDVEVNLYPTKGVESNGTPWEMSRTGYTFGGWRTVTNAQAAAGEPGKTFAETERVKNLTTVSEVVDLYAVWVPNSYTVRFSGNTATSGANPANIETTYDATVTMPANPYAKTGYLFKEWNTKQDGTGAGYDAGEEIKEANLTDVSGGSVTLYAIWAPIKYKVNFHSNGGAHDVSPDEHDVSYDEEFTLRENTFTKTGYLFKEWNTAPDGKGKGYTPGKVYKNLATTNDKTVTLYAVWVPVWYNVRYNLDGGVGTAPPTQGVSYDQEFAILPRGGYESDGTPWGSSRTGYAFGGWRTLPAADVTPDNPGKIYGEFESVKNLSSTDKAVVDLYAVWVPVWYNVRYNLDGGGGTPPPTCGVFYDQVFPILPDEGVGSDGTPWKMSRTGYAFGGWRTLPAADVTPDNPGTVYAGFENVKNLASVNNAVVDLYAIWKANSYTVKFDGNKGTGAGPEDIVAKYDATVTMPANTYARAGYSFKEWNTKADGTGTGYAAGQEVEKANLTDVAGGSVTLYAVWAPVVSVDAPLTAAVGVSAQGTATAGTATFASRSVVPLKVATATCATVPGANGTEATFPKASQWPSIAVVLEAGAASARLPLGSAPVALSGFTVPAATSGALGELSATFGLDLPSPVDVAGPPADRRGPFANVTFTFEIEE